MRHLEANLRPAVIPATAERSAPTRCLTWKEMRARLRADRRRLHALLATQPGAASMLPLHPSYLCVALYRLSNYLYRKRRHLAARLAWQLNFLLTGADLSPASEFGEGLLILAPAGCTLIGAAGRNLTVMPCAGIGGEMGNNADVGAGPGLPLLGDDVTLEPHCGILGPIRVGDRVRLKAGVVLTRDAPAGCDVEGPEPRFIRRREAK